MEKKRIWGVVLAAVGIAMIITSIYIKGEVASGKERIAIAQGTMDQGKKLFGFSPATKPLGEGLTSGAQRKIDEGREDVKTYTAIANGLMVGGILCIIGGGVLFFIRKKP